MDMGWQSAKLGMVDGVRKSLQAWIILYRTALYACLSDNEDESITHGDGTVQYLWSRLAGYSRTYFFA